MAEKVSLVSGAHEAYGLGPSLRAVGLSRSTWYDRTRTTVPYAEKYAHLEYGYRRAAADGNRDEGGPPGAARATGPRGGPQRHGRSETPMMRG
ncbi:hypothetical protein [Candidatus Palauibacter sp.]|uniref:hypothetical protein n=1 Tax=Candidatus Palauibacter sp. TaxID=3101350 RepID=UPI003B01E315